MKIYGSFNADSYQEVSIDWLTVAPQIRDDITEVGTMSLGGIMGQCAIGLLHTVSINWTARPDEIAEKTRIRV